MFGHRTREGNNRARGDVGGARERAGRGSPVKRLGGGGGDRAERGRAGKPESQGEKLFYSLRDLREHLGGGGV